MKPANGCQYIDGDPGTPGWRYCGKKTAGAKDNPNHRPWCKKHLAMVYRPAAEVNEKRAQKFTEMVRGSRAPLNRPAGR